MSTSGNSTAHVHNDQIEFFVFMVYQTGIGTGGRLMVQSMKNGKSFKCRMTRISGNILQFIHHHRIGYKCLTIWYLFGNFIESDMMDRRVVSEAQLKNRIDAFFEGLATRRQQAAIRG